MAWTRNIREATWVVRHRLTRSSDWSVRRAWGGGLSLDRTGSYAAVWAAATSMGILAALRHWPIRDEPLPASSAAAWRCNMNDSTWVQRASAIRLAAAAINLIRLMEASPIHQPRAAASPLVNDLGKRAEFLEQGFCQRFCAAPEQGGEQRVSASILREPPNPCRVGEVYNRSLLAYRQQAILLL
jgi:hypothetical protein